MYSRQEATKTKQEFWTAFGMYMSPVLSSEGEKVNWINYRTGVKDINFKLTVERNMAEIRIELSQRDELIQEFSFDQLSNYRNLFEEEMGEVWDWSKLQYNEAGRRVSTVRYWKDGMRVMDRSCWPDIISFFKPRLIKLDTFWNSIKYGLEGFQ